MQSVELPNLKESKERELQDGRNSAEFFDGIGRNSAELCGIKSAEFRPS